MKTGMIILMGFEYRIIMAEQQDKLINYWHKLPTTLINDNIPNDVNEVSQSVLNMLQIP